MATLTYRGDAPAQAKVVVIKKPRLYSVGAVSITINNKTVSYDRWDSKELADRWNSSGFPETSSILASTSIPENAPIYGVENLPDMIVLQSTIPGEDFFVEAFIDGMSIADEIQTISFSPVPSGGTFTLQFDGHTTGPISVATNPNDWVENVRTALEALPNINPGDVDVFMLNGIIHVKFIGSYAKANVPKMTANSSNLLGGDATVACSTVQDGVDPVNEVQSVTITSGPTGGTFTLTFSGQTTAAIPYNANASAVQTALEGLSNIASGDVAVTGGPFPSAEMLVEFTGTYSGRPVSLLTADAAGLTGGSVNVYDIKKVYTESVSGIWRYYVSSGLLSITMLRWAYRSPDNFGLVRTEAVPVTASLPQLKALLVGKETFVVYEGRTTIEDSDLSITGNIGITGPSGGVLLNVVGKLHGSNWSPVLEALIPSSNIWVSLNKVETRSPIRGGAHMTYRFTDHTRPGTYTLTVYDKDGNPHITAPLTYNATALEVQGKVNSVLGGDYCKAEVLGGGESVVLHFDRFGYQRYNLALLVANENAIVIERVVPAFPGTAERQYLTVIGSKRPRSGTFTLTYDGNTTSSISITASNTDIKDALEALPGLGTGSINIFGGPIQYSPVFIEFPMSVGDIDTLGVTSSLNNAEVLVNDKVDGGLSIYPEEVVRNRGPECFDDPLNYNPHKVPSHGDHVVFEFGQSACRWGIKQRDTFTVYSVGRNLLRLTCGRPLFQVGQELKVKSTGTLPGGLSDSTTYFVIDMDGTGVFQLSTSLNGPAVDVTSEGTGVHTIGLELASITKPARYSYSIGLERNAGGFVEYRPRYLEVWCPSVILGERSGDDSGLVRLNLGDVATNVEIYKTGTPIENNAATVGLLINNSSSDIKIHSGSVGLALFLDESCVVRDITASQANVTSVGQTTCRNITADSSSEVRGNFIASGRIILGV